MAMTETSARGEDLHEDCLSDEDCLSIEQRVKLFAALADPTRLRIVELLAEQQEASSSSLAKQMGISLALFCHHSKTLLASDLVQARRQGKSKLLSLNPALWKQCCAPFEHLVGQGSR